MIGSRSCTGVACDRGTIAMRGKEIRAEPFAAAWQGDWTTAGGHKWFKTFQAPGLVLEQHAG
jgi:hypothetical protein